MKNLEDNNNIFLSADERMRFRKSLFVHAVKRDELPFRVPNLANIFTWKVVDSPYTLTEGIYDYDKLFDIECMLHKKYNFDLYSNTGIRNVLNFSDCFGKDTCYFINDETYSINYPDSASIADADDMPDFFEKGLVRYYFERGICRKYELTDTADVIERFKKAAPEFIKIGQFRERINSYYENVFGVPNWAAFVPEFPCDTLFKAIRGMKGFSIDLRRNPEYIEEGLKTVDEHFFPILKANMEKAEDVPNVAFAGGRGISLCHTVLNAKQFEKYHWPYIKRYVDMAKAKGLICSLFFESSIDAYFDILRDLPEKTVGLQIELTDAKLAKEKLPNVTIMGGYPNNLLGFGTVLECIDKAKEVLDDLAYDGNYIFTTDKMMSFPADAKPENLMAVNSFIREYGVYRRQ